MDAMADEQPTQNESTENWMRNERMEGGVSVELQEGGWVEFRRVMGQLLNDHQSTDK